MPTYSICSYAPKIDRVDILFSNSCIYLPLQKDTHTCCRPGESNIYFLANQAKTWATIVVVTSPFYQYLNLTFIAFVEYPGAAVDWVGKIRFVRCYVGLVGRCL